MGCERMREISHPSVPLQERSHWWDTPGAHLQQTQQRTSLAALLEACHGRLNLQPLSTERQ